MTTTFRFKVYGNPDLSEGIGLFHICLRDLDKARRTCKSHYHFPGKTATVTLMFMDHVATRGQAIEIARRVVAGEMEHIDLTL